MFDADVIVVGFRCAGAPLAYALQRAGVKVIVVDRDPLFSDQPISTHAIQPYGMRVLDKLGLGDAVRELAPANEAFRFQLEDAYMQIELNGTGMDSRSPRRSVLDPALQRAALAAGVEARDRTSVLALLRDGDRVVGVRVQHDGSEYELRAPLVVGADGRNSTVAKLVDAPTYLETKSPHAIYWSYFEESPVFTEDPRYRWGACIHIERDEARAVFQTDSGLLLMAGGGRKAAIEPWRKDPESNLLAHLRNGSLTAPLLEGSRMVAKPVGVLSLSFFIKQAVGPGWALVGDSGLHIDPTPGLGITDAVRDAAALAEAIIKGGDQALHLYWRRRDADSIDLYHFAANMGSEQYNNPLNQLIFRRAQNSAVMKRRMAMMMEREIHTMEMFSPLRLLGWLAADTLKGNLAPWSSFAATLRFATTVQRQQSLLDRALAKAERGDLDPTLPQLTA